MEQLGLTAPMLDGIKTLGFKEATPIQASVIPLLLEKKTDLVALAQTGTGKTAAYGLPLIQQIDIESKKTQALILSPTRELCIQITKDLKNYGQYVGGLNIQAVYGGTDITRQISALKKRTQIIVATPGRMLDLIRRKKVDISYIHTVVLDEADEMLNMGFQVDLNAILSETPDEKNTWLFSATMPQEAERISRDYMDEPVKITVGKRNAGAQNVEHVYYVVQAKDRYLALKRIADLHPDIYGLVFCRTRKETKEIADQLIHDGYNADALHGDLSQAQRDMVMRKFRNRHLQLLVATDVAARGLDVNDLSHIINFDLPDDLQVYTHRSGRTGRAGKSGISVSIIHSREKSRIKQIEQKIGKKFTRLSVPKGDEICESQLLHLVERMENVEVDDAQIDRLLPLVFEKIEHLNKEELIKRFVALEFNRFLTYYKNAPDLDFKEKPRKKEFRPGKRREYSRKNFTRFFIDLGAKDKLDAGLLIGLINRQTRSGEIEVGKIEIMSSFSFFEVDEEYADFVLEAFTNASFNRRQVHIELAQKTKRRRNEKVKRSGGRDFKSKSRKQKYNRN